MSGCAGTHRTAIPPLGDSAAICMSIAPPSDIVLDALMAADPAKSQAVAEKLTQLRPSRPADFDTAMVDPASTARGNGTQSASVTPAMLAQRPAPRIDTAGRGTVAPAFRKFEAFVLQTFIETMLPRDSTVNFGKGIAGDVWRSMLAEQLGSAVANSGGVGIAKFLAAAHAKKSGGAVSPRPLSPATPAQASAEGEPARSAAAAMLDDLATKT